MDHYTTLGVSKTATKAEIKQAYRRMANKYHPDKGGDSAQFQKIQKAYDVLSDESQRAQYDNPTKYGYRTANNRTDHERDFYDVFNTVFNRRPNAKNRDITISIKVTLEDIFAGKIVTGTYRLNSGREETVKIKIPPGARSGDNIRYNGMGDDTIPNIPRGNLHVNVQVRRHKTWGRDGDNLYATHYVSIFDLMLGTSIKIESIDGKLISVNIPKGTPVSSKFNLKGYGIPNVSTGVRGNAYIQVETTIPVIEDETMLTKIAELKNEFDNCSK